MAQIQKIHGPEDLEQIRIHLNRSIEELKEQQGKCTKLLDETSRSFMIDHVFHTFLNEYKEGTYALGYLLYRLEEFDHILFKWQSVLREYEEEKLPDSELFNDKEQ